MTAPTKVAATDWLRRQTKKTSTGDPLPVSSRRAAVIEVEAWLQRHGVAYAPAGPIPLSVIDERKSRANQARRDAIVADSVERFATAMRNGVVFPPIVVYPVGARVVVVDGNNRHAGARKAALETIEGIVLAEDTPSELIQLLTVEANSHHGVTPELSWRLQQAFYLVSLGFSDVQAAEAASVSHQQLRNARSVQEADQRAKALKIGGFTDLASSARQALNALKDEAVFYQAARLAAATSMTLDQVRDMTRAIRPLASEAARVEAIGTMAKERKLEAEMHRAAGKVNRVSSPKQSLVTAIGQLLNVDEAALVRQIATTHDRDLINNRLKLLEDKILALQVAMETLEGMEIS